MGKGGGPDSPPHAGTRRPSALRVPQLVRWSVGHSHVYMEKWRVPPGPYQFLRIGFNVADLGSRRDMPIWKDGGSGMANTKPQLTVMEKAADRSRRGECCSGEAPAPSFSGLVLSLPSSFARRGLTFP